MLQHKNKFILSTFVLAVFNGSSFAASDVGAQIQQLNGQIQGQFQVQQAAQAKALKDLNTKLQTQLKQQNDELNKLIKAASDQSAAQIKKLKDDLQGQIKQVQTDCAKMCAKPNA